MIKKNSRSEMRARRQHRTRKSLIGTGSRPRLNVFRSQKHIYAQIIDDLNSVTLISASSLDEQLSSSSKENQSAPAAKKTAKAKKEQEKNEPAATSVETKPNLIAKAVGQLAAKRALDKGIKQVVFDRGGFKYHGRVKALAEAAREAGLQF